MAGKLPSFFNETIEVMLNLCLTVYNGTNLTLSSDVADTSRLSGHLIKNLSKPTFVFLTI